MTLNDSIRYDAGQLHVDEVAVRSIVQSVGTPVYIYSLKRALQNLNQLRDAFSKLDVHIHYSAKANANRTILKALIQAGVGIDTVSGGEIYKALQAGCPPGQIVFAGVGKTRQEIEYALQQGIGWFNVENHAELDYINRLTPDGQLVRVALRLNPDITANTHPYIATGHGGAKFGLTASTIREILAWQDRYPNIQFEGIHIHIGSQLGDTKGTQAAIQKALELMEPYPQLRTVNIGGGIPAQYQQGISLPTYEDFAEAISPLLNHHRILLEPGRSIIADAGILVGTVLYTKEQAAQKIAILDGSMTELMRPALYQARHEIILVEDQDADTAPTQIVGPVCETTDVLGKDVLLPELQPGDLLAILTAGAYGAVMSSNYNARPRPAEVLVAEDGQAWQVIRERETWEDLSRGELAP